MRSAMVSMAKAVPIQNASAGQCQRRQKRVIRKYEIRDTKYNDASESKLQCLKVSDDMTLYKCNLV